MSDFTDQIFEISIASLLRLKKKSREQTRRLNVFSAHGPYPLDPIVRNDNKVPLFDPPRYYYFRALKRSWYAYIKAAEILGFFEGKDGKDLLGKLISPDTTTFLAALAECKAIWYLSFVLNWELSQPKFPLNHTGKKYDIRISKPLEICGEVKNTWRPIFSEDPDLLKDTADWEDDSDFATKSVKRANGQFCRESTNLLILVPSLRTPIYQERYQLTRGLIGESIIGIRLDPQSGKVTFEEELSLRLNGQLLSKKAISLPSFTRISTVLSIEHEMFVVDPPIVRKYWNADDISIRHHGIVLHNPYCKNDIPYSLFTGLPQLLNDGEKMWWSDGHTLQIA